MSDRPRLTEPPPLAVKYAREYEVLYRVQQHFSAIDDPRFGVIPVLDRIESARALVMGEIQGSPMNGLLPQLSRGFPAPPSRTLREAVENAGAWLRGFHQLELDGTASRQSTRDEFVERVGAFCEHLETRLPGSLSLGDLRIQMATAAERLLPSDLPLGLSHGDFAMRNILVGPNERVFVFDTTAFWLTPVYADLAKFVLAIRLSRPQVYSHGLAFSEHRLREATRWLLSGYYGGGRTPEKQVALYALLLLLDKWSFELALPARGRRLPHLARRRLLSAWFHRQARQMLALLA